MMTMISPAWIVQTLIASTVLMALVLALRAPVMRLFGARIAYALWLLPALRMVLPPLPGWRTLLIPVAALNPQEATFALVDAGTATKMVAGAAHAPGPVAVPQLIVQMPEPAPLEPLVRHPAAAMPPPAHPVDWAAVLLAVWLGGALVVFVTQLVRYHRFLRRALKDSFRLSRECGIDVLVSERVAGPIAAGILKRRILLPGNFLSRYSSDERRLALRHEAAHHDRLDIPANLLALVVVALHWWNPLAHRAYRAFRADQELACDATVLAEAGPEDRHSYGSAMLKSASGHMPAMACALSHKDQLRKRIMMMANARFGPFRLLGGAALAATAIGGGLLLTATGQAQTAPAKIATVDVPPSVPQPPAPPAHPGPSAPPAPPAPMAMAVPVPPAPPAPPARFAVNDREAVRKAAECARKSAEQAREAGRQAAEAGREASRQAEGASREAARQAAETGREAARQAALAARDSARQARISAEDARRIDARARASMPDTAALIRASMESARMGLRASCEAQGVRMATDADMGTLATCGNHMHDVVLASLRQARAEVAGDRSIPDQARAQALAGIDAAIAGQGRTSH